MSSSPSPHLQQSDVHAHPRCIASTRDDFCRSIQACDGDAARARGRDAGTASNLFRAVQFAPDGSSVIACNEDHSLRTFIVPPASSHVDEKNVDDNDDNNSSNDDSISSVSATTPHLTAHARFQSPSNIHSYAVYPFFNLQNPAMSVVLCASAYLPISLRNALDYSVVHGSYPLVDANTEQHRPIHSLTFSPAGTHVLAGSDATLAVFDAFQAGAAPVVHHRLRPGRRAKAATGGWQTCRGSVMALDTSCDGTLALGTTGRDVALFEHAGLGACAAVFSLASPLPGFGHSNDSDSDSSSGAGIMGLRWSPCGRYLVLAERNSDVIQVYDIRGTGAPLAVLRGRNAHTLQRMGIDLAPTAAGFEVWAGGMDGRVRMWKNPAAAGGDMQPAEAWRVHDAPVSSAVWSRDGGMLATCSGARFDFFPLGSHVEESVSNKRAQPDNSLKLWQQS